MITIFSLCSLIHTVAILLLPREFPSIFDPTSFTSMNPPQHLFEILTSSLPYTFPKCFCSETHQLTCPCCSLTHLPTEPEVYLRNDVKQCEILRELFMTNDQLTFGINLDEEMNDIRFVEAHLFEYTRFSL